MSGADQALCHRCQGGQAGYVCPGCIDKASSNEAILARHRDYFRMVHPDVKAAAMREAEAKRTALCNAQAALQSAIGHLQAVLNESRTHAEQQAADAAARQWLESIGSEPD